MSGWRASTGAERFGIALLASFLLIGAASPLAVSFAVSPDAIERGEVVLTAPCPTLAAASRGRSAR